jgi:hypothetical protein
MEVKRWQRKAVDREWASVIKEAASKRALESRSKRGTSVFEEFPAFVFRLP